MISLRCAPAAEERGDPLHGSAPPADGFVLIEQPGAWGARAVADARLPQHVLAHVLTACRVRGARLLLIRRAHRDPDEPYRLGVADSRRGHERIAWSTFSDPEELLDLPLAPPETGPMGTPVLLTCTHGRRDPCCARRGWPVTAALAASHADRSWQCSHVGGDRFAANVVVVPYGLYFGRVTPESALELVAALDRGETLPELQRGRSIDSPPVQSALHYATVARGERRLDAIVPTWAREEDGHHFVGVVHEESEIVVRLRRRVTDPIERLTCAATAPSRFEHFELVSIDTVLARG